MGSKLRLDYELSNHPLLKRSERCICVFTPKQLADFKGLCETCESMGITKKPDPLEFFSSEVHPPDKYLLILTLVAESDLLKSAYFHELVMSVMKMGDFSIEEFSIEALSKLISQSPDFTKFCNEIGHAPLEVFSAGLGYLSAASDSRGLFISDGKTFTYSTGQMELLQAISDFLYVTLFP